MRAIFYCDIISADTGETIEKDFDFDSFEYETTEELERYIKANEYDIGEIIGYWGSNYGVLTEICRDD